MEKAQELASALLFFPTEPLLSSHLCSIFPSPPFFCSHIQMTPQRAWASFCTLCCTPGDSNQPLQPGDPHKLTQQSILVFHPTLFLLAALPLSLFFLFSSMYWTFFFSIIVFHLPFGISFFHFRATHKVSLILWAEILTPGLSSFLLTFLAGGIRQTDGFLLPLLFLSPLLYLCVFTHLHPEGRKFSLPLAFILFGLACVGTLIHGVLQEPINSLAITTRWFGAVEPSPAHEKQRWWVWSIGLVDVFAIIMIIVGYTLRRMNSSMLQEVATRREIESLVDQLTRIELESLPPLRLNATLSESTLYKAMLKIREWKPYIPSGLLPLSSPPPEEDNLVSTTNSSGDTRVEIPLSSTSEMLTAKHNPVAGHAYVVSGDIDACAPVHPRRLQSSVERTSFDPIGSSPRALVPRPGHGAHICVVEEPTLPQPPLPAPLPGLVIPELGARQCSAMSSSSTFSTTAGPMGGALSVEEKPSLSLPEFASALASPLFPTRLGDFHATTITYAVVGIKRIVTSPLANDPAWQEKTSAFYAVLHDLVTEEKGAVYQFDGEMAACIWMGANQQVRGCIALSKLLAVLNGGNSSIFIDLTARAAISSGIAYLGTNSPPVIITAAPQAVARHLYELTHVIEGRFLADWAVVSQVSSAFSIDPFSRFHTRRLLKVQFQFEAFPVDIVSGSDEGLFPTPTKIFELCAQTGLPNAQSCCEWMYHCDSPTKTFHTTFESAFHTFADGRMAEATVLFTSLIALLRTESPEKGVGSPMTSSGSSLWEHQVMYYHLMRLKHAAEGATEGKKPVRVLSSPWALSY